MRATLDYERDDAAHVLLPGQDRSNGNAVPQEDDAFEFVGDGVPSRRSLPVGISTIGVPSWVVPSWEVPSWEVPYREVLAVPSRGALTVGIASIGIPRILRDAGTQVVAVRLCLGGRRADSPTDNG